MRALIYDKTILPLTSKWYRAVLGRLSPGARLLDVGIGTGGALAANASLVVARDLHVVGVDIDADYVNRCRKAMAKAGLSERVTVVHQSIHDFHTQGFDAVYFSASFMLMPDPQPVLEHVMTLLAPNGRVYFTQTFEEKRSKLVEVAKPLLHKLTTIHFGKVTYEPEFFELIERAGLRVIEHETLDGNARRTFRLVVGTPA